MPMNGFPAHYRGSLYSPRKIFTNRFSKRGRYKDRPAISDESGSKTGFRGGLVTSRGGMVVGCFSSLLLSFASD